MLLKIIAAIATAGAAIFAAQVVTPRPPPAGTAPENTVYFKVPESHAWDKTDLSGRVAIVTGGSSGIGRAVAKRLVSLGATVVITSRSQERAEKIAKEINKDTTATGQARSMSLDLTNFQSVKHFANEFLLEFSDLHYFVENAGLGGKNLDGSPLQPWVNEQGFEHLYVGNYLGHFLLLQLLLPTLTETTPSRITLTSSIGHWVHDTKNLEALLPLHGTWAKTSMESTSALSMKAMKHYANTKFLQISMAFEAQRRFPNVVITPTAPGLIKTDIGHGNRNGEDKGLPGLKWLQQNVDKGAETTLHALLDPSPVEAGYFLQPYWTPLHQQDTLFGNWDCGLYEMFLQKFNWGIYKWRAHPNAYNIEFGKQLWEQSMLAVRPYLEG